jgi:hypothetical protein
VLLVMAVLFFWFTTKDDPSLVEPAAPARRPSRVRC